MKLAEIFLCQNKGIKHAYMCDYDWKFVYNILITVIKKKHFIFSNMLISNMYFSYNLVHGSLLNFQEQVT